MRTRATAGLAGAAAVIAGATGWLAAGRDDAGASGDQGGSVPTGTALVERRDLVDREDVDGTLGYGGAGSVSAIGAGTITRVRREGATAARGDSLYSLDGRATGFVMYGSVPAYRALDAKADPGPDIRQLERNLVALGYDPYGRIAVGTHWDAATTAAVKRWQDARGVEQDGRVELGEVVFCDGPVRVGKHALGVGDRAQPDAPVTKLTSRRQIVLAPLEASRQATVREGRRVSVVLPDGDEVPGRIASIGRIAEEGNPEEGGEATVELRVRLLGKRARRLALDRAPVTVSVASSTVRDALAVPVTALVATGAGRYAVELELPGGRRSLLPVEPGAFADGYVEVGGRGLRPGQRVTVPR